MRTSSYTIYVDLPGTREEVILVHGYTNAYFRVSRRIAAYLRSLERRRAPKPLFGEWSEETSDGAPVETPSPEIVHALRQRGFLTDLTFEEEEKFFCNIVAKMHEHSRRQMPSYMFMPTYDCNLRCGYCYQTHLRTNPLYSHTLKTMSMTIVERLFRGIATIEKNLGIIDSASQQRKIGFFGGEPLLASSRPVVERIMNKALEIGPTSFWAVSNATELDAFTDLLSPELLSRIQVTIDGPPEVHDRRRIYADGSGSFDKIASNIGLALDRGVSIGVRMNVDRNNLSQIPQLAETIQQQGWDKYPRFSAYVAPIRKFGPAVDISTVMNSWELDDAITKARMQNSAVNVIGRPSDDIRASAQALFRGDKSKVRQMRESGCSAHSTLYMFDAFASIYFCWEYVGEFSARAGYVAEDGSIELNQEIASSWRDRTVASNSVCRQCRYALSCGGGCAASALARSGKMNSNYCDGFATRFRHAIGEAYLESKTGG